MSGGKAGKGKNATSSVQVFNASTNCVEKLFRFKTSDYLSKTTAINKAGNYSLRLL